MDELAVQAGEQLHKLLYDDSSETGHLLKSAEAATGMAREHFVYGLVGIIAVYLVAGKQAQLLSSTICFVIPTIIAYHTLRDRDLRKYRQLIVYWTAYAALGIVDAAYMTSDHHRFSLYWLIKTALLLLLLIFPDGPQLIYDYFMASTLEAKESVVRQPSIADDVRSTEAIEPELINIVETTQMNEPPPLPEVVVEKKEEEKASIVEEKPPSPEQPMTEEERLKAKEAEEIKPNIEEEAWNEIRPLNEPGIQQLLDEALYVVTPITHSSTPPVTVDSAAEESSGTGVDEQQKDEASIGTDDRVHFEQNAPVSADISEDPSESSKLPTDAESNVSQSLPLETPEPHVPTLVEDVAVDQPSTTLDSETSPPLTSRVAHDSLNDSTSDSHQTTTTALNQQPTDSSEPPLEDDDLWMEPNGTLVFNAPFHEETLTYPVRLTNTCQKPLGFNIKSNALPRLSFDRGFGVLATGESVQLAVSCAPFVNGVEDTSKDCITIEYMTVPVDVHDFGLDWFLNKNGDFTIKRKNLIVQYNA